MTIAILAIISSLQSNLQSSPANNEGLEVSPAFNVPAELIGSEPLKVKDGERSIGRWRTSRGLVELKIMVRNGKRTIFMTVDGKRLKEEPINPVPRKIKDYAKKLAVAEEKPTVLEAALSGFVSNAYAVDCAHCHYFKIVRDCYSDGHGGTICDYWIVGCGHVCGHNSVHTSATS
jgi:hypothetical protein